MIIPLQGGAANARQVFNIQLGENLTEFRVNYLQTGQWSVDLYIDSILIAAGAMLEPNADIIKALNLDIGHLVFIGDDTTLDNLGKSNFLHWIEQT